MPITITIDGPSGSGKGTTAKMLAQKLGFKYLDTGAMYRALGVFLVSKNVDIDHICEKNLEDIQIDFSIEGHVQINGENYEPKIRNIEASVWASKLSAQIISREFIISAGRKIVTHDNYVLEGRDTGTVWFPDAEVKIYLTADADVRAHRRWLELQSKGENVTKEEVLVAIKERDRRDMARTNGPLCKPEGAHLIDTTHILMESQVEQIYDIVQDVLQKIEISS